MEETYASETGEDKAEEERGEGDEEDIAPRSRRSR